MVNPAKYVCNNNLQTVKVSNLINEFKEELMIMSGTCMDIGCGPGDVTKNLLLPALHPDSNIIGTDILENMIKYANQNYANDRIKFEVLDIQTKNLPPKYVSTFDHIFSFHALQWCNDIRQTFENIYDILRPGGTILILTVESHDSFEIFKQLSEDLRYAPYVKNGRRPIAPFQNSTQPSQDLKYLLRNIGFEVHHCSTRETSFMDKGSSNFMSSILSITSFLDHMPENISNEFCRDFKREFTKKKIVCTKINDYDDEQMFLLDMYNVLVVYAKKL